MAQAGEWGASVARGIGQRVKRYRKAARLSAEQLAQQLDDAGVPMTRSVLASLESGRRPVVSVAEWLILARLLNVPPLALLVDYDGDDELVALLPDSPPMLTEHAVGWLRDGVAASLEGQRLAAWLRATEYTRAFAEVAARKSEGDWEYQAAHQAAYFARQAAEALGLRLPTPPQSAAVVQYPPRPGVTRT